MPTGINSPGGAQRQNPLEYILQGLQVAGAGLNIANDIRTLAKPSGPSELDIAKAGFKKKSPIAAAAPDASAPASPLVAGAPATATAGSPLAQVPAATAAPKERFTSTKEYQIGNDTYTRDDDEDKLVKQVNDLSQEYENHNTTKRTYQTLENYNKLQSTVDKPGKLGVADVANVYSWFHVVEPSSTVKDGEFKVAENASGYAKQFANILNKLESGQSNPDLRLEFKRTAKLLLKAQLDAQRSVDDKFENRAKKTGLNDLSEVVNPIFKNLNDEMSKETSVKTKKSVGIPSPTAKTGVAPLHSMDRAALLKELGQ